MLRIIVVGLSYKTSSVEVREKFSFPESSLQTAMDSLLKSPSIKECCIVSTCNRVEIYAVCDDDKDGKELILSFLSSHSGEPVSSFKQYTFSHIGSEAVRHLFRVASGMESMVVGEPQIFGQVKAQYKNALTGKKTGLVLNRLFNRTFFVAKKIRTETKIAAEAISISYLAVELAKRIFEDLTQRTVMLIGTGEMSELAAKHLISNGIKDIYIASRDFNNAKLFAKQLNGKALKMEEVFYHLKQVDIVVTATGSSEYIIKADHIKESLKLRKNEPMFIIDIAVPRDIDPKVDDIQGVYLYDIDDLKGVSEENLETRKKSISDAEELVVKVEQNFTAWLKSIKVFPTIIDLKSSFESIKDDELAATLNKLQNLSPKEKAAVEKLASSIIGKIIHKPITKLKRESSSYEGALYSEVIKTLFDLDKDNSLVMFNTDEAQDRH